MHAKDGRCARCGAPIAGVWCGPGDSLLRRARHVVEELAWPAALAAALGARDFAVAGRLLDASHASLRDLFERSPVRSST